MSYQKVTGALTQGAHPGSYNGQDAYNDMLVVQNEVLERRRNQSDFNGKECWGGQRMPDKDNFQAVIEPAYMSDRKGHNGITEDGTATTLTAEEKDRPLMATSIVRRLTPRECERLQGMPDDWSRCGINEKGAVYELPDSARYRLQGNGIATPFWRWMLERISTLYDTPPTMGSLFDGQGSFPMLWEDINGKGTAVWSSEIEKHAVAVSKYHFPEQPQDAPKHPAQPHETEQGENG